MMVHVLSGMIPLIDSLCHSYCLAIPQRRKRYYGLAFTSPARAQERADT